jgi:hypothetical protein
MRIFDLLARMLITAAVLVLALKSYAVLDTTSNLDDGFGGNNGVRAVRADVIATAIQACGILLALAGAMIALDRRTNPR